MEGFHEKQLAHLRSLADELRSHGFDCALVDDRRRPAIEVSNPDIPSLAERVMCWSAADGSWCFWWPWRQPIGSVSEVTDVSAKVMSALRGVEGSSGHE